jgi:hypothetical protein
MEMHYVFNQSTGGSAGSGAYLMTFPVLSSTITADTTFVNTPSDTTSRSGHVGMGFVTNATDYLVCTVQMYGSNKVYVSGTYDSGIGVWGSSFFPVTNATTDLGFIAHVPISEWKDS